MTTVDLSALIADAKLPERTVEICLRGDLVAELEELEHDLGATKTETLADRGAIRKKNDQIKKLREEMQASLIVCRVRGLNRRAWSELVAAHPPRDDNAGDRAMGYNTSTFFSAVAHACIVEPEISPEQWAQLEPVLSAGMMDALIDAALDTSRRKVDVPFSPAASASPSNSDETSK